MLPEQIADLVSRQVTETLTEAIKQILQEERSLLISSVIAEVNSHLIKTLTKTLSESLKVYFEEQFERQLSTQLAIKEKAFELDLQTKIDELKFQHYQQLERLGQAVEQVMTSHSPEQILDEDEIYDRLTDDETDDDFDQFTLLKSESEFFEEHEFTPSTPEYQESDLGLNPILIKNEDPDRFIYDEIELNLLMNPSKDYESDRPTQDFQKGLSEERLSDEGLLEQELEEQFESETLEIDSELNLFDLDNIQDLKLDSDEFTILENNFESNLEPEVEELKFDDELNLFAESSDFDFLSDDIETISNQDINKNSVDNPEINSIPDNNEFDRLALEYDLGEPLQPEIEIDSVININDELNLFDLDDNQELVSDTELEEFIAFERNLEQEVEDLKLDDELNLFAESATPDFFNDRPDFPSDEIESIPKANLLESELSSDPFDILSSEEIEPIAEIIVTENSEDISEDTELVSFEDYFEDSPEIIYEGEEYQFDSELLSAESEVELDGELDWELEGELSEGDRLSLDLERELELQQELLNSDSLMENCLDQLDRDDELSEFADSEAKEDFWAIDTGATDLVFNPPVVVHSWHLGIDFGYSAIRACLFNQSTDRVYPLSFDGEEVISTNITIGSGEEALSVQGFKQFLRLGIPYRSDKSWQPLMQWTNKLSTSLKNFQISTQDLLAKIKTATHSELSISDIMANLDTVILGYPHSWSDAYIFNLRESVLESGLIANIEKVLVIDQAIALLFPSMPTKSQQLFIDSGVFTTSLGFTLDSSVSGERRFDDLEYAGLGINQDIVLQLLYPKTKGKLPATKFILAGEPNSEHRADLQQFLIKSPIGLEALAIAEQIKLFFSLDLSAVWQGNLGGKSLKISRSELEIKVIQPFIQSLNDVTDRLIYGTQPEDITDIAIAGGTMQIPEVREWLESKFANARVSVLSSSNLAQGLAIAPKYSQYLDINRHQYSDYFLLSEICALNLQEPINLVSLMKKLQNRGVNAKACSHRLARILLGQIPAGVLPWQEPEKSLILPDSNLDPDLLTANLFTPVGNDLYQPNPVYAQLLGAYLKMLESSINQSFSEPLVFPSFVI